MKPGMSHYSHKSIADAQFESGSFSSFRDMTSQNFPQKKEASHHIWDVSMRMSSSNPPELINFAKIQSEHVF